MRVVEIAKNHGLAVTAGLDTGGLQADADALGAEIALFHDAPGPSREVLVEVLDVLLGVAPVEAAAAVGAGGHAEPAADAAVVVHDDDPFLVAEGGLGRADTHAGRIVAVVAEDWQLVAGIGLVPVEIRAFREGVFETGHPDPFDFVFLVRELGDIVDRVAGGDHFLAETRILTELPYVDHHTVANTAGRRLGSMTRGCLGVTGVGSTGSVGDI